MDKNIEIKRFFRFIVEKDYLKINHNGFNKIIDFMFKSINEEDSEENCIKFFFAFLHGIYVEN